MKIVCLLSGGLDSSTLLYYLKDAGHEVLPLAVVYGQRHRVEIEAARRIAAAAGVELKLVELPGLAAILGGSSQTDVNIPVPHGHYEDESMKVTVVPNRNMMLIAAAAGYAISQQADAVAVANHAGDHAIYPDCRGAFVDAMHQALRVCDYRKLELLAPFTNLSKTEIAQRAGRLSVPVESTWSCYDPHPLGSVLAHAIDTPALNKDTAVRHCGRCGTCVERIEALQQAGLVDPTLYAL